MSLITKDLAKSLVLLLALPFVISSCEDSTKSFEYERWTWDYAIPDVSEDYEDYLAEASDIRVSQVPAYIERALRDEPEYGLEQLVYFLVYQCDNRFHAVKILHDWIVQNITYDYETLSGSVSRKQDYLSVIRNRQAICSGFATLFQKMCTLANIPNERITGHGRGSSFSLYNNTAYTNHAWNCVELAGEWYFVDTTWDITIYGTRYFLAKPEDFIYTHFPADEAQQKMPNPISAEEFIDLPKISPHIVDYSLLEFPEHLLTEPEGDSITLNKRPAAKPIYSLNLMICDINGNLISSSCISENEDIVEITFPYSSTWRFEYYQRGENHEGNAEFYVEN